jgi:phosphatidate cytidylyltransferase
MFYFLETKGLLILCYVAVFVGLHEFIRMLLSEIGTTFLRVLFALLTIVIFSCGASQYLLLAVMFTLGAIILAAASLLQVNSFKDLDSLALFQIRCVLGFVYLGLLPAFAAQILWLPHGMIWFVAMMAFVFSSDTFAYLAGWTMGKHLLMPAVSPKKTIEGSIGGLVGASIAGYILHFFLPEASLGALIVLALLTAVVGQFGDLFESMLKRVAHVKDSGTLMPGHGGVLYRLDGILFAAPVIWAGAALLEKWF